MAKERIKQAVGLVVLLLSVAWLFLYDRPSPPFDPAPHAALGTVMAEEALKLIPGGEVILIVRDTQTALSPAADRQEQAFRQTLEAGKGRVVSTFRIKLDPLRVPAVPPMDFFLILRNAKDNQVVVSFAGPPTFPDTPANKLSKVPKVIALCPGPVPRQVDVPRLAQRGLITLAVVDRVPAGAPLTGKESLSTREIFDRFHRLATPSSLASPKDESEVLP